MGKRLRVVVLFGGKSVEHEVSLVSAQNIVAALDSEKYEVALVGIDKDGVWHLLGWGDLKEKECSRGGEEVVLIPHPQGGKLYSITRGEVVFTPDVVFPVLHGTFGEDGTVQGLLEMVNIPYVGSGVLGSSICMDKEVTKRLLKEAGLPVVKFLCLTPQKVPAFDNVVEFLGLPFFVKPASLGSSVGIAKVRGKKDFEEAVEHAFSFDVRILLEECIVGREIECSVLGNEAPVASLPGEIVPRHEFYSYEAKYLDPRGADLLAPALLEEELRQRIQEMAVLAFRVCHCEGMARVDFFLRGKEIFVNEVNTIPGFTPISMYPKLWEVSGIPYPELVNRLIALALERAKKQRNLRRSYRI
ncbi:MAG: D-alanine--D-alanine ligase family protein [Candidatus Caldatribacteriaceae bacterium]